MNAEDLESIVEIMATRFGIPASLFEIDNFEKSRSPKNNLMLCKFDIRFVRTGIVISDCQMRSERESTRLLCANMCSEDMNKYFPALAGINKYTASLEAKIASLEANKQ